MSSRVISRQFVYIIDHFSSKEKNMGKKTLKWNKQNNSSKDLIRNYHMKFWFIMLEGWYLWFLIDTLCHNV